MLKSVSFLGRNRQLLTVLPFAMLFAAACNDDASVSSPADAATVGPGDHDTGSATEDAESQPGNQGMDAEGGGSIDGSVSLIDASAVQMAVDAGSDGGAAKKGSDAGADSAPNPLGLGPAPVNLGSTTDPAAAGSYVLLAKTGITNVTGSAISGGNVGLSPAAATFITGFTLTADSTNVFSTSTSVVAPAKVYASDYAAPTPSNLTTAVLAMQTAYTDAAGRTNPTALNLNSGNLGGLTLAPGLYTWGTGVTVPTDVTFSGGANDVWILQISNDLDVSSAKNVILSGGANAKNIFWQVAGQATIHANAHFAGIILAQTAITLQTTASMQGRALAQSLVALDNNAVTAP